MSKRADKKAARAAKKEDKKAKKAEKKSARKERRATEGGVVERTIDKQRKIVTGGGRKDFASGRRSARTARTESRKRRLDNRHSGE